jgi:hypothetical protein
MSDTNYSTGPFPVPPPPPRASRTIHPRPLLLRLVTDHNPFYLLSAACMLASCLALTNSLSWTSITRGRLLTLIVTLNLYEAALLAIALFLIVRRRLPRDGRMLLLLQAFFLVDFTFLNAEIVTADLAAGVLVNAALFALAAVKVGVVLLVLRPSFTPLQFTYVMAQLAVLFAMPCVFRWLDAGGGTVNPRQFYAAWWATGLLPAAYELFARLDRRGREPLDVSPQAQSAPTAAYLALPYVSLLAHVGILHYVYDVRFYGAHAAPVLLGLTLVLNRYSPTRLVPRTDLLALRIGLPAMAVLVSIKTPFSLAFELGNEYLTLTPLHLAVTGAFLTYVYCFLLPHALTALAAGAAAVAVYVFGPSRQQVVDAVRATWTATTDTGRRVIPKTLTDWGILGLVASFAFLALGFWISLRKRPAPAPDRPNSAPGTGLL